MADIPNHPYHLERQSGVDQPIIMGVGLVLCIAFGLFGPGWLVAIVACIYLAFIWSLVLTTTVEADHVDIRFRPFMHRRIGKAEIEDIGLETFQPIRDWGGWGVRMRGADRAYTMSGNRAVALTLSDGNKVLIGSPCPEILLDALARMRED
ncbi:MAG: hypothetical protein AAF414_22485 [Pseudomonadota bacterium]